MLESVQMEEEDVAIRTKVQIQGLPTERGWVKSIRCFTFQTTLQPQDLIHVYLVKETHS